MKHCIECKFHKKEVVQMGPQMGTIVVCTHEECSDPVTAEPLQAQVARQNIVFCGLEAKRYVAKSTEPPAPIVSLIQKA